MMEMSSVVPEEAYLPYYIVSMDWYKRWQNYCNPKDDDSDEEIVEPGPINGKSDVKGILHLPSNLFESDDHFYRWLHLKDATKENIHYKVLDQDTFNYL